MTEEHLPFVTALLVVRNEEDYVEQALQSLIDQDYPKDKYEIIVIDGCSTDSTLSIINSLADQKSGAVSVNVMNNPNKILASGWNIGIRAARGNYVFRIDAHSAIPRDYASRCVDLSLQIPDAACVGGRLNTEAKGGTKAISYVLSSPFGVGNSRFRYATKEGYVDTVAYGLYRKSVFDEIGLFDETLKRHQDLDLHSRIKSAGYKFYMDPSISATYFSRNTVHKMMRQGFQNGYWNLILAKRNPKALAVRHVVPLIFVLGILGSAALGFLTSIFWYIGAAVLAFYFLCGLYFATKKSRNPAHVFLMPFLYFLLHASYGWGSICGVFTFKQ